MELRGFLQERLDKLGHRWWSRAEPWAIPLEGEDDWEERAVRSWASKCGVFHITEYDLLSEAEAMAREIVALVMRPLCPAEWPTRWGRILKGTVLGDG